VIVTNPNPPPPPPPTDTPPPPPSAHPAYLDALRDLRYARALLEKPARADVKWDEQVAVRYIDGAISEIRSAAIDDGKALTDHPMIVVNEGYRDRLRRAMILLRGAMHGVAEREDNIFAKGLRNRAVNQISQAEHAVAAAIGERAEEIKLDQAEKKEAAAERKEQQAEKKEMQAEKKEVQAEKKEVQAEKKEMKAEKKEAKAEKELAADKKDQADDKAVANDKKQLKKDEKKESADKKKLKADEKKDAADDKAK
jgi:hypothetical protein